MDDFIYFIKNLSTQILSFKGCTTQKRFSWHKAGITAALFAAAILMLSCGEAGGGTGIEPDPVEKPDIELSNVFSTGATLTWTPPEDEDITSYTITFRPASGGNPVVITVQAGELVKNSDGSVSYNAEGLTAETEYTISLVPKTAQGDLEAIETKDKEPVTTNRAVKPSTPTDLTGELEAKTSSFTASLSWTAPTDPGKQANGQSSQIASYVLYWNQGTLLDAVPQRVPLSDSRTAYTIENLEGGTNYIFVVTAVNDQDLESSWGLPFSLTTPSLASPPGKVASVIYQSQLSDGFTLSWNPVTPGRASTGAELTPQYEVYLSDSDTASAEEIAVEGNLQGSSPEEEITISGLNSNTSYYLVIKSFTDDQKGIQERLSDIFPVSTTTPGDATTAPGAPQNLAQDLSHKEISSLKISWEPGAAGVNLDGSGEADTLYLVEYRKSGETSWEEAPELSETAVVLTGLEGAEDYQVRVKAINSENKAKTSTSDSATLKSNGIISIILTKDGSPVSGEGLTLTQTGESFSLVPQFETHNFESERTVNWASSNTSAAEVNSSGTVSLMGEGQTVITAASTEDESKTASVSITIVLPNLADENIQLTYEDIDRTLDQGIAKTYFLTITTPPAFPWNELRFALGDVQESGNSVTNPGFRLGPHGNLHLTDSIPPGEYELFINASRSGYSGQISLTVNLTITSVAEELIISYGTLDDAQTGHTMMYSLDSEASTQPDGVILLYTLTSRDSQDISGISINQDTGTITVAETTAIGTYLLTVTVSTEDSRYSSGSLDLEIRVLDNPPLTGSITASYMEKHEGTQWSQFLQVSGLPAGMGIDDLTLSLREYQKKTREEGITPIYEDIANPGLSIVDGALTVADTTAYGIYRVTVAAHAQDLGFSGEITKTIELGLLLGLSYGSNNLSADYGEVTVFPLTPSPTLPGGTVMEYSISILNDPGHESGITIDEETGTISVSGTGKLDTYSYVVTGEPANRSFRAKSTISPIQTIELTGGAIASYLTSFSYAASIPAEYNETPPSSYKPTATYGRGAEKEDFSYRIINSPPSGFQVSSDGTLSVEGKVPLGNHEVIIEVTKADAYGSLTSTLFIEVVKNNLGNNLLDYGTPERLSRGEEKDFPVINTTIPSEAALVYSLAPTNSADSLGDITIDQSGTISVPSSQNQGLYSLSVTAAPGNTAFYQGSKTVDLTINVGGGVTVIYKPDMEAGQDYFTLGDRDNPFLFELQQMDDKDGLSAQLILKNAQNQAVLYNSGSDDILTLTDRTVGAGPRFTGSEAVSAFEGVANIQIELTVSDGNGEFINQSVSKIWGGETSLYGWRDLQAIQNDLSGHYSLKTDIAFPSPETYSFPSVGFIPLGSETEPFSGSLTGTNPAGGKYRIIDLFIEKDDLLPDNGLFGYMQASLASDTLAENLIFLDPIVKGTSIVGVLGGTLHTGTAKGISVQLKENLTIPTVTSNSLVSGGIVGELRSDGLLLNVDSQGNIQASNLHAGGLVGRNQGRVTGYATGTVNGTNKIGGLVGTNHGEIIGYASGNVTGGHGHDIGGLVGHQEAGSVIGYYTEGTLTSEFAAGGLAGYISGGTTIGYVTGTVVIDAPQGGGIAYGVVSPVSTLTAYSAARHVTEGTALIFGNAVGANVRTYGDRTHSPDRPERLFGTTALPNYTMGVSGEANIIRRETTQGNYQYYDNNGTIDDLDDDVELFEKTHGTEDTPIRDFNFRQPSAGTPANGLLEELGDWTWLNSGRWPSLWDTPEKTYFGDQPEYKVSATTE